MGLCWLGSALAKESGETWSRSGLPGVFVGLSPKMDFRSMREGLVSVCVAMGRCWSGLKIDLGRLVASVDGLTEPANLQGVRYMNVDVRRQSKEACNSLMSLLLKSQCPVHVPNSRLR